MKLLFINSAVPSWVPMLQVNCVINKKLKTKYYSKGTFLGKILNFGREDLTDISNLHYGKPSKI